ncbi:hypothetical protein WR25_25005 [Diploscapter pachys]|uniref:Uncharacterized protein n=1 Tax=Diploscapter pachys TaxID=2018661 RepID=A0A2A2KMA4_9BILA|nr:hypothetical protein WR25_25005 [Diploscapter pachys]
MMLIDAVGAIAILQLNRSITPTTLSRKRITSSMKTLSSFHSSHVSRLSDDRQQTAVRSLPRWSRPVGSVISEHRFDVETFSPRSR